MRYGQTLRNSIYPPWKANYIDYGQLKKLLRENASDKKGAEEADNWTEEDEGAFVEELVNVQLEKVNSFQKETYKRLRDRTSACETRLEPLVSPPEGQANQSRDEAKGKDKDKDKDAAAANDRQESLRDVLHELDQIAKELNELEKYSRINFTGFLKAAKKHDRRRGLRYRVRPLLQVRLGTLAFNSEDYSPLLYRLSAMYSFVRQHLDGETPLRKYSSADTETGGEKYSSFKFWVHPDNLLELKTYILRRLPVLVYNPQTSKIAEGAQRDPTITSLYFDNSKFSCYTNKVERTPGASSVRLRWYGQLSQKPEIFFEKKTVKDGDESEGIRFPIKEKYIERFIQGDYKMEKSLQKLSDRHGPDSEEVKSFKQRVDSIQSFIQENDIRPMLRANYTRTAFQLPGDNRVRISLNTDLALIREDALDADRPIRDPDDWHRSDIDSTDMEYPFDRIRKGEISRFPYALLDIKVENGLGNKAHEWVSELMSSHLVKEAPRFSKFVHGVAQLFEDYVNSFPFWLSELEVDIRKDPETAFEEEQEKKAKRAEEEFAVGSFLGSRSSPAFKAAVGSPAGKSFMGQASQNSGENRTSIPQESEHQDAITEEDDSDGDEPQASRRLLPSSKGFGSLLPSFSTSKYARAHQAMELPPGVTRPSKLIKDSGPVKVEAKVWLANQRTFIKWQHISVLLASLSLGLFNAAGATNNVARGLAVVYTLIAAFAAGWGWWTYVTRSRLIQERSGKDFDFAFGPVVVCVALIVALCLNFAFKYRAMSDKANGSSELGVTSILNDAVDFATSRSLPSMKQDLR
ncbi:MAG: hypothetical protein M1819_001601 [Sarea resinae]|nr:MAG: hypothetical protein M1819_001601 [Sarea resinae]